MAHKIQIKRGNKADLPTLDASFYLYFMGHKIQIKRGNKADLPTLDDGEFGLCQDTAELFIGNSGNVKVFPTMPEQISADIVIDGVTNKAYTATEKTKLAGIANNANNYSHPASHPASMITQDASNRFVTDAEKAAWNSPPASSGKRVCRFVVGTSTAGWTAADCDYLCDGTADQTEINAAITALPATGGEIVILDGTYNITAKIDVTKDNVSIRGNGNATVLKRMFDSSVDEGVITLTSRSGCKISNLQVDGNKGSYTNYRNYNIYLGSSSNNTIIGNTCNNSYGIYFTNSSNNTVTGNTCYNNGKSSGIQLDTSSNNNTVTGNNCNSNKYGIRLYTSRNNTVTSNICCNNNSRGIYLDSSSNNTIVGNTCNNNDSGIYLTSPNNSNTVVGNTCNNNGSGIYLNSSSNCTVTSNICIRGTGLATDYTAYQHTIQLSSATNNYNLISNNNCMGKAVTNAGGTGNTLVNNKFDAS